MTVFSYSDDDNVYPLKATTKESENVKMTSEEQWKIVTEETDCRPKPLPDFSESSGPTFSLPTCSMSCDVYKKMLPDFLFNHIAECTNLRVKRHFGIVGSNNDKAWSDVR